MWKRIICFLLIVSLALQALPGVVVQNTDTAAISTVRHFNADALNKYKADKDFNYSTTVETEDGGSFFSYLLAFLIQQLFGSKVGGVKVSDVVIFALILFAAVMLVMQVFKVRSTSLFSKNTERLSGFTVETENIQKEQFDTLIEEAMANGNYRLAVRIHYLKSLRALSDAGLINWKKNKTNFEYYYELKGENIRREFHELTVVFESVWYGHHEISAHEFSGTASSFNHFLTLVNKRA